MSRWTIEKSGTGIEKSGTGIEKAGSGIEKAGTGIRKANSMVQRVFVTCSVASMLFSGGIHAGDLDTAGALQIVNSDQTLAVSWIIDGSVFVGVAPLNGSYANLMLTEVALSPSFADEVISTKVTGNGTGSNVQVTGNGTGFSVQVTGNGTGSSGQVTGNGTGSSGQVTGNGTGSSGQVTGNGTGSTIAVTGNGSGADAIRITLPGSTGLAMEISIACGAANVTVLDASFVPVVSFENVAVIGDTEFCSSEELAVMTGPGRDFR